MNDELLSEDIGKNVVEYLLAFQPEETTVSNFFSTSGAGYFENPTSDLMALFMGKDNYTKPWLLTSLLKTLGHDIDCIDLSSAMIFREATTSQKTRLDIFIKHDDFIIGIENKVFADTYNPFSDYNDFLNIQVDNNQTVYRCILKPDSNPAADIEGWETITYSKLVQSALENFGLDMLKDEFSKWTVFYREFLEHLLSLSGLVEDVVMKEKDIKFVEDNFHALVKVEETLALFKQQTINDVKFVLSKAISDSNIVISTNNWEDNYKAIHLTPSKWGDSGVSFVYYPSSVGDGLSYYINAWISKKDYPVADELYVLIKQDKYYPELEGMMNSDSEVKITKNTLEINYMACHKDKSRVLTALETLAAWMSKILQK
ncbi:PD-(D/E)XK nuclease family protein [Aeromonas sanarellii]|uniref:PD-(D/E)XK nuclease family protein n=1 Tax=Aeromonas media TaxID=651 RepID=UPI00148B20FF|nr:PD-(D/E)XK nuclease family protein [Aeromonas media]QJT26261.1 PD-(D/E)XK nuclease superfamily protein [Aeromonas media]